MYELGHRVVDSLKISIKQGMMYGPLQKEELPWIDLKASTLLVSAFISDKLCLMKVFEPYTLTSGYFFRRD